ncbi:hypothetical protein PAP_03745 [Palaeococcus pacificus DY20341]|uniref:MIP18 family-like domain-containing protein n=1 Tax=Palaeococcus pacificus DY20341 TaxID=1343739 RepID=A0A075LX81_9EURY|nr:hypothetical protein [Palaeococcus pacificus]AIF69168.1 hypothetical protein PAP_03745 [Palaeococcus pacificus DY20341]
MEVDEIYEELKKVKEPISGEDIVSLGIVSRIIKEDHKVLIFLNLVRRTPRGPFGMALHWPVYAKIIREIVKVLGEKLPDFEIIDDVSLQRYYPLEEV